MLFITNYINEEFTQIEFYDLNDEEKDNIIKNIEDIFCHDIAIFRATGLWNNISELLSSFKEQKVKIYEGDKNKLFIRKCSEIIVDIDDFGLLNKVLDSYVTTIYEGRYLYLFTSDKKNEISEIIQTHIYNDNNLFEYLKNKIDCLIEKGRESMDPSSFSIIIKKEFLEKLNHTLHINNNKHTLDNAL